MTVYFPLVAHGAMLIEPTESESKSALDQFIAVMRDLAQAAIAGDLDRFQQAPRYAPRRRLDETRGGARTGTALARRGAAGRRPSKRALRRKAYRGLVQFAFETADALVDELAGRGSG